MGEKHKPLTNKQMPILRNLSKLATLASLLGAMHYGLLSEDKARELSSVDALPSRTSMVDGTGATSLLGTFIDLEGGESKMLLLDNGMLAERSDQLKKEYLAEIDKKISELTALKNYILSVQHSLPTGKMNKNQELVIQALPSLEQLISDFNQLKLALIAYIDSDNDFIRKTNVSAQAFTDYNNGVTSSLDGNYYSKEMKDAADVVTDKQKILGSILNDFHTNLNIYMDIVKQWDGQTKTEAFGELSQSIEASIQNSIDFLHTLSALFGSAAGLQIMLLNLPTKKKRKLLDEYKRADQNKVKLAVFFLFMATYYGLLSESKNKELISQNALPKLETGELSQSIDPSNQRSIDLLHIISALYGSAAGLQITALILPGKKAKKKNSGELSETEDSYEDLREESEDIEEEISDQKYRDEGISKFINLGNEQ